MSKNTPIEQRLEVLGESLRARQRVSDKVMEQIREGAAEAPGKGLCVVAESSTRRRRRILAAAAGVVATFGVAAAIAIVLLPSPTVSWAEVTKAIQAQKWIRLTSKFPGGKVVMWRSPERKIWAIDSRGSITFLNGDEGIKYVYGGKSIIKLPLSGVDLVRVGPVDASLNESDSIQAWLPGDSKIVSQDRRQTIEDGKKWVDFHLFTSLGPKRETILRVDPTTRLPVSLKLAEEKPYAHFDYPDEGPADIYALGVSRDSQHVDQMPKADAGQVIQEMQSSRERIGDFRMLLYADSKYPSYVVWRKGIRWRVDRSVMGKWRNQTHDWNGEPDPAETRKPQEWLDELLKPGHLKSEFICDGKTMWEDSDRFGANPKWTLFRGHMAPLDFMSGDGEGHIGGAAHVRFASQIYPNMAPELGRPTEFEPHPAEVPGCILLKKSVSATSGMVHWWAYVDPAHGYAIKRLETFHLHPDIKADPKLAKMRSTLIAEDFELSPQGFWYPKIMRITQTQPEMIGAGDLVVSNVTFHYHFDFDVEMPDSLFIVDKRRTPIEPKPTAEAR